MPFTNEDIQRAKNINIIDFLENNGVSLERKGKKYTISEHNSLIIDPDTNLWYWNSQNKSGKGAIDFVMTYFNCNFVDAIGKLLGSSSSFLFNCSKSTKSHTETKKNFKLVPANKDYRRMYAYLTKSRGISADIISRFVKAKVLYEDTMHNSVFVGLNDNNIPAYASVRGSLTDVQYRKELPYSDKQFGFCHKGNSDKLYVFEAAIDLLSYISLHPDFSHSYIALGGLNDAALKHMLSVNSNIKQIVFCLDCDTPGIYATHMYIRMYSDRYSCTTAICDPVKDWNEYLTYKGGDIKRKVSVRFGSDRLFVFDSQQEIRNYLNQNHAADNSLLLLPSDEKETAISEFLINYQKQRGKKISNIYYIGSASIALLYFLGGKTNG